MIVLGQIYAQENQPDKAITALNEANDLITARHGRGRLDDGRRLEGAEAEIPVTIAQAYISAKRYDEASARPPHPRGRESGQPHVRPEPREHLRAK
jgi:hypothetical protein